MTRWPIVFLAAFVLVTGASSLVGGRLASPQTPSDAGVIHEERVVVPEPRLKLNVPKAFSGAVNASFPSPATPAPEQAGQERVRRLIRSGEITLLVPDIERALAAVRSLAAGGGGFVQELDDDRDGVAGAPRRATLKVAVPAEKFETTLDRLAGLGGVRSRVVDAEDVTDQLVDDVARLRNLRRTESDMLRIMDRAGRIGEVLDVENQLSTVRDSIERLDAERASLAARVAFASISVTVTTEEAPPAAEPSAPARLRESWRAAAHDVREFSLGLAARLLIAVAFAPYGLAAAAALAAAVALSASVRRGRNRARAS